MSDIQILEHKEFGQVRSIIDEDGTRLFCGKDVAVALGYSRPSDALMQHCRGAVIHRPIVDRLGRTQQARFITEADVFRLIAGSKLPNAQRFEAWLFEDIAPKAARGELVSVADMWAKLTSPESIIQMAQNWQRDRDRANALEAENATMRPKALFADAVSTSHTTILVGDLAKLLKQNGINIGQKRLFIWLRAHGYLMRVGTSYNMPTQRAMELKLFRVKERTHSNPDGSIRVSRTTLVTGKGQEYFINLFLGKQQKGFDVQLELAL